MKKEKRTLSISVAGASLSRRLILLLTFGTSLLTVILAALYQMLIANFGTDQPLIYVIYYLIEAISVCSLFCFVALAFYLLFAGEKGAFTYSLIMYALAGLFISVLLNTGFVWLLAYIGDNVILPFEISNYTLSFLEGPQILYLMSMSFVSMLSSLAVVIASAIVAKRIYKTYLAKRVDTSLEKLCSENNGENPLYKPSMIFVGIFSAFGFAMNVYDTVQTVITQGAPSLITEYVYLIVPYFMLLIYVLAGYFAMQYFAKFYSKRMLELSAS